jgi:fumarylacetoacetate (FAA) hydrolase
LAVLASRVEADGVPFLAAEAMAPMPRAYQWLDASAFQNHSDLMGQAFGFRAEAENEGLPLVYQGASDRFIGPRDDILLPSSATGNDFEAEFCVVLGDVPMGATPGEAERQIRLVGIVNDVSLRNVAVREMRTGFGFIHAKPASSFGPVFVTPDELGENWSRGRVCLPLEVRWNGEIFGHPNGAGMSWSFGELISYVAGTRALAAGTIFGSGTVSNAGSEAGSSCISERRALEVIREGKPRTPFMSFGDRVVIETRDGRGASIFGAIDQQVAAMPTARRR